MKFVETPDRMESADREVVLKRWRSPNDDWHIDLVAQLFGIRCCVGRREFEGHRHEFYSRSYCCGQDRWALLILPCLLIKILDAVPEGATPKDVEDILPQQSVKPIALDQACWRKLCELAGVPELGNMPEHNPPADQPPLFPALSGEF